MKNEIITALENGADLLVNFTAGVRNKATLITNGKKKNISLADVYSLSIEDNKITLDTTRRSPSRRFYMSYYKLVK